MNRRDFLARMGTVVASAPIVARLLPLNAPEFETVAEVGSPHSTTLLRSDGGGFTRLADLQDITPPELTRDESGRITRGTMTVILNRPCEIPEFGSVRRYQIAIDGEGLATFEANCRGFRMTENIVEVDLLPLGPITYL